MKPGLDTSGLKPLAVFFDEAIREVPGDARAVVKRGAQNIKTDAKSRVSGLAHARLYPASITYDTEDTPKGPAAEVGPDKKKPQGPLGNLLEGGSPTSPPHPHMAPAVEAEEPKFARAAEELAAKHLGGGR